MTVRLENDNERAEVTGEVGHATNFDLMVETDVIVYTDVHEDVNIVFKWGRKGYRETEVTGDDVRALARVFAHALGTGLADEVEEPGVDVETDIYNYSNIYTEAQRQQFQEQTGLVAS